MNARDAFAAQGDLVVAVLRSVPDWHQPSRLPGWDVATLVAHMLRGPIGVTAYAATPVSETPTVDSVSYWHIDGRAYAPGVSQRATEDAAHLDLSAAADRFAGAMEAALHTIDTTDSAIVLSTRPGTITLGEFVSTRVVELTIHTMDLTESIGQPPAVDSAALAITVATLEKLLVGPRPADLADDIAFLEAASGRVHHAGARLPAFSS